MQSNKRAVSTCVAVSQTSVVGQAFAACLRSFGRTSRTSGSLRSMSSPAGTGFSQDLWDGAFGAGAFESPCDTGTDGLFEDFLDCLAVFVVGSVFSSVCLSVVARWFFCVPEDHGRFALIWEMTSGASFCSCQADWCWYPWSRCDRAGFKQMSGMVVVGWLGRGSTTLHCTHHALPPHLTHHSVFSFPSLPGPVVGEMPSATR